MAEAVRSKQGTKYSLDKGVYYHVSVHEDFYKSISREKKINQII